jgi:multidrug efflux pump subunit AcrA (membrane-fusion protein)
MQLNKMTSIFNFSILAAGIVLTLSSCGQQAGTSAESTPEVITPVQVTRISHASLADYSDLTAVSSFQQKSYVKANINGYVQSASVAVGQQVHAGKTLFSLITKEARAIGNAVNKLDPGLQFSGISVIRADQSGFITTVSHQKGDYVQDGEALAVISNQNSFVFLLDLPYELHKLVQGGQQVSLSLPDGTIIPGTIAGSLPAVDSLAQTQRMVIRVNSTQAIPEGLIAKVRLTKASSSNAQVLPRSAVLTNETEEEFWVMKLINDSIAVKVSVKKGLENDQFIEILSPAFGEKDRIVSTGNYGIADTARIKVVKQL